MTERRFTSMKVLAGAGGVMAGIGGGVHGVGEALQGSGRPDGIFIESWTTGRIATNLGGEPGITLVPDLLLSGLLTLACAAAIIWWSVTSLDHPYCGRVLAVLALVMLLVGGGVGPPTMALLAALVAGLATRDPHPLRWPRGRAAELLAASWPTLFWLNLSLSAFLVFGSLVAGVVLDVDISDVFVYALLLTLLLMPLAALAGVASRALVRTGSPPVRTAAAHSHRRW